MTIMVCGCTIIICWIFSRWLCVVMSSVYMHTLCWFCAAPWTEYRVYLRAFNSAGASEPSNDQDAHTDRGRKPPPLAHSAYVQRVK